MYDGHCRCWNLSRREIIWNFLPNWYDQSNEIVSTKRIPTNKKQLISLALPHNSNILFCEFFFFFHIHCSLKLVNLVYDRQFTRTVIIDILMKYVQCKAAHSPTVGRRTSIITHEF